MEQKRINPTLKLTLEIGPIILFFVGYTRIKDQSFEILGTTYEGFIVATAVFIPLILASTAILWRMTGRLSKMQLMTAILVVVFGGLGIWFNDDSFFKMKPTILYLAFAGALGFGLMRGKSYLQYLMDEMMPLKQEGWFMLTRRTALFFAGLAVANEVVWRNFSTDAWVNFKTFGLTSALFLFFIAQARLFSRFSIQKGGEG